MINGYTRKRRLKKIFSLIAFFSVIAYIAIILLGKAPNFDKAAVKINGKKIYKSEIVNKISQIFMSNGGDIEQNLEIEKFPEQVIETFAKEIYLEKILVKKAKKVGLQKDPEIKRRLDQEEAKILIDAYLDYIIEENVTEESVKQKYAELMGNLDGKKEYSLSHIVVEDERTANTLYRAYNETASANKPRKFADLARRYSIDKESANKKGQLGYVLEDNIIKEIADIVLKMKKGEYSRPIKTDFGWHIVEIEEIRDAKTYPFEEVKDSIKQTMIKEQTKKIYDDIFDDAKIKVLIKTESQEEKTEDKKDSDEEKK